MTIQAGESVAIIGPSGCGKTTLMKVMMGLFQPTSGAIYLDDMPLSHIGHKMYRTHFGAVMQNDQLLSGSIGDNIAFFEPIMDEQRVQEVALNAVIHQDVLKLPMGYNTLIGDMGTTLSGGQKQRVLLARALYKNPSILFLDEATSHLDVALEQAVNHAVKQLKMTRIIIAHRPETIRSADRIFVLTPEGIVEQTKRCSRQPGKRVMSRLKELAEPALKNQGNSQKDRLITAALTARYPAGPLCSRPRHPILTILNAEFRKVLTILN